MRRDERGSALIEFIWLGLLLLIPLVYIVLTASDVQRAAYGASTASRSAGRAFVLAPDPATAYERASRAAQTALDDQGVAHRDVSIEVSCQPSAARCLSPGSSVTVVVTVRQRLPLAPDVLGSTAPAVTVDARHTEPYGTFREGRS